MLNNQNQPLISVIMSIYNGEKYLKEAIDSILGQSYKNFEFIIINDGSIDNSLSIVKNYKEMDNRIVLIENSGNKGLIYSLNRGLDLSKGKYIARMDADDISEKNRFLEQISFLEKNENIAMCSTYVKMFKDNFKFLSKKFGSEIESEKIKTILLFKNYIAHPTVMIRKEIIDKYNLKYNSEDKGMEDYGLWLYLSKYENIATIPKYLLRYRFLGNSISSKTLEDIENHKLKLKKIYFREFGDFFESFSDKKLDIHTEIALASNLRNYKYTLEEKAKYLKIFNEEFTRRYNYKLIQLENESRNQLENCYIHQEKIYNIIIKNTIKTKISKILKVKMIKVIKKIVR